MITLDISPHVIGSTFEPPFSMESDANAESNAEQIRVHRAGDVVATARQSENPRNEVRFFHGKGGFCTVVSNPQLVYFGLPGSRIELEDTEVVFPGAAITGKPKELIRPHDTTPTQQVTDQAMILGAGLATRFEPISGNTTGYAKPGVPLYGEDAVITVIAKLLRQHGFKRILINTFYMPESLKAQLDHLDGLEIVYLDEEEPSGTAGGLALALEQNRMDRSKPIFIVQGDAVTDANFSFLMDTHQKHHAAVTIGGQIVSDQVVDQFGIVQTNGAGGDGQSGQIISFIEKPSLEEAGPSRFANAGFYILSPETYPLFLELWKQPHAMPGLFDYAKDFFPAVLDAVSKQTWKTANGQLMTFWAQAMGGYWSDIGNPTQYMEALHDVYEGKLELDPPKNLAEFYDNGVVFWPGTRAIAQEQGAKLQGNVIVARRFS